MIPVNSETSNKPEVVSSGVYETLADGTIRLRPCLPSAPDTESFESPSHPSENPSVMAGEYPALITGAEIGPYHKGRYLRLELLLWEETPFVTNVYFPNGSTRHDKRFWYLCQSAGVSSQEVKTDPSILVGRTLRVTVSVQNRWSEQDTWMDVHCFLMQSENWS